MKNKFKFALLFICLTLFSCSGNHSSGGCGKEGYKKATSVKESSSTGRIILKESAKLNGRIYQIIEVDGHEYFANSNGGIIDLELE